MSNLTEAEALEMGDLVQGGAQQASIQLAASKQEGAARRPAEAASFSKWIQKDICRS